MSKKPKYEPFENLIKEKFIGFESDYGKDWSEISSRLDALPKKSNKNTLIITISFLIGIGLLTSILFSNSDDENLKSKITQIKTEEPFQKNQTKEDIEINQKKINSNESLKKNEINNNKSHNLIDIKPELDTSNSEKINVEINDTTSFEPLIEPISDSSSYISVVNDTNHINQIIIGTDKTKLCFNDSITVFSSGCDSCLFVWKINGIEYVDTKEIKLIAKENLTILLYKQNRQDTTNHLKDSLSIPVYRAPEFEITYETTDDNGTISTYLTPSVIKEYSSVNYSFLKDGNFNWDFGDGSFGDHPQPRHEYETNGKYIVYLTYKGLNGCTSFANVEVEITSNFDILAPNTFTPNGDGINDVFMPEGVALSGLPFEMVIFNKFGKTIFSTQNANNGWSGFDQITGKKCQTGNYLWLIRLENEDGTFNQYKGSILLVD